MSVRISLRVLASATNSVRWVGLSGGSIRRSTLKISIPLLVRVVLMRNHSVRWVRSRWPCGKVVRGNAGYQCVIERIRIVLLLVGIQFVHILTASTISGRVGVDRVGSTGGLFEERIGKVGGRKVDGFLSGLLGVGAGNGGCVSVCDSQDPRRAFTLTSNFLVGFNLSFLKRVKPIPTSTTTAAITIPMIAPLLSPEVVAAVVVLAM